jgi:hypothetical protein
VNFTVTGVPFERGFALLVLFVGDIAQELAIAEECRRNPQAATPLAADKLWIERSRFSVPRVAT